MKKKYLLFMFLFGLFLLIINPDKVLAYDDYVNLLQIKDGNNVVDLSNPYDVDGDTIIYYLQNARDFRLVFRNYNIDDSIEYQVRYTFPRAYLDRYVTGNNFTCDTGWDESYDEEYAYIDYFYPYFSIRFVGDDALKIKVGESLYTKMMIYFVDPEIYTAMDEYFNSIAPEGKLEVDSVYNDDVYISYPTTTYGLEKYNTDDYYLTGYCDGPDDCILYINSLDDDKIFKTYSIKYIYKEGSSEVLSKISKYLDNFDDLQYEKGKYVGGEYDVVITTLEDLSALNYLYTIRNWVPVDRIKEDTAAMRFSNEILKMIDYNNIDIELLITYQKKYPTYNIAYGYLSFIHDGLSYLSVYPIGYEVKRVIYIPDETEDTQEAYIEAATNRIKKYVGEDVEITYKGNIDDLTNFEKNQIDVSKTLGEYYKVKMGAKTNSFFIVKDSSKMQTISINSVDFETSAKVVTDSYKVPLDSKIVINDLDKDSDEYKNLMEKLHLTEGESYDINLVSSSTNISIDRVEDGLFKVYIPLSEDLAGKDLVAYYLNNDGTIEEFEVTIENGYAVFETSHFSVYTLAEKQEIVEESNPPTGDSIKTYMMIGEVSMLMLLLLGYTKYKNKRLDS